MSPSSGARHAVYFAPDAEHPLWQRGCEWLGREPDGLSRTAGPAQQMVATPWRYGFHATLKAPLRLVDGAREQDWLKAVEGLAARHRPFMMPALQVARLSDFLALCTVQPVGANHPLRRLADDCVLLLDSWRAPVPAADAARPTDPAKNTAQHNNLLLYGYPHVFGQWRFHMTLSNRFTEAEAAVAEALGVAAAHHFGPALALPLPCHALCVFVEPGPGEPFELRHRFALGTP
jgi:Protein of unknown function (DUF1045)